MARFDQIWIDNRLRYRKSLHGTRLQKDPETGYLMHFTRQCFSIEKKLTFMARFRVCSNMAAICRSIPIDLQAVYDALALDQKFREDFLAADQIPNRSKRLNDELKKLACVEKTKVITDLSNKLDLYK